MKKIPFDAKFRPEIESGEFKVVTKDDRSVQILSWEMKGNYPILGCLMEKQTDYEGENTWEEERPKAFNLKGIPSNYVPSSGGELYIVIPDSEESVLETTLASMLDYAKNHAKPDADVVSIFKDRIIECVALEKSTLDESTSAYDDSKRIIQGLWRDAAEEPEAGRELITLSSKGIKVYPNPKNNRMAWPFFKRISRITSWFYSDELLPVVYTDETI